jgi:phenylacetate-CoA ligase
MASASDEETRRRHLQAFAERVGAEAGLVTWPLERLLELRDERLRALVRHARQHSEWHRERLAGIDADALTGEDMTALPTMDKADLMDNWDAISTDPELTLERALDHLDRRAQEGPGYLRGIYQIVNTGGSSGHRAVMAWDFDGLLETALSRFRHIAWVLQQDPPPGPLTHARLLPTGGTHISSVVNWAFEIPGVEARTFPPALPRKEVAAGLQELQPVALTGYPSLVHEMAVAQIEGRLDIHPRFVAVSGEPLPANAATDCLQAWGHPVVDVWGASETGELAVSNPLAADGSVAMHRIEDATVMEPVDATGAAVPPGTQAAKLYVTNVINQVLPIIRYELDDTPTFLDEVNPGPWTGRRVAPIEGRGYEPFVYHGLEVTVYGIALVLRERAEVLEFQVRQTPHGVDVDVLLDAMIDLDRLRSDLAAAIERSGLRHPDVRVRQVESIPRNERTGKVASFVALRSAG